MMRARKAIIAVAAVAVIGVGGSLLMVESDEYSVDIVVPSAAQLLPGSPIWVNGMSAGSVNNLEVRDNKAIIHADISADHAPLREGTTSRIEWNSVVGERVLTLYPGPEGNVALADGAMFESQSNQVEIDEVLAALDPPTRERLSSLVGQANETVSGSEREFQATVKTAGPAVHALQAVLEGVGRDGPAIRDLVTQLNELTASASAHGQDVAGTVENLSALTGSVAEEQSKVSESLKELPGTLRSATDALGKVPAAGEVTTPLLEKLDPATRKLLTVSQNLRPVLQDLRPAIADLGPTLKDVENLLGKTPPLMDKAHGVLPPVQDAVQSFQPAVAYLRPYTPELIGWLSNFGQSFAGYDSQGHFWAATLAPGTNAVNESPGQLPTSYTSSQPSPGEVVGQPWRDAHGSGMK